MRTLSKPGSLLKHIYDSATHFAIFTTDVDGKINTWNLGAEKILGFSQDDMIGSDLSRIFTQEDRAAGEMEQEMTTAAASGRAADYRWHLRKNGSRFWADGMMTPIRSDSKEIIGYLKILQDITERKAEQDELTNPSSRVLQDGQPPWRRWSDFLGQSCLTILWIKPSI